MDIGSRMREWRSYLGLQVPEMARVLGCESERLEQLEKGEAVADGSLLSAFSQSGVSMAWLLHGKGPRTEESRRQSASEQIERVKRLPLVAVALDREDARASRWKMRLEAAMDLPPDEVDAYLQIVVSRIVQESTPEQAPPIGTRSEA